MIVATAENKKLEAHINNMMEKYEELIQGTYKCVQKSKQHKAKYLPTYLQDEVLQEARIKLWGLLIDYYKNHDIQINDNRLDEYVKDRIYGILRNVRHAIVARYYKYNSRMVSIDPPIVSRYINIGHEPIGQHLPKCICEQITQKFATYPKERKEANKQILDKLTSCLSDEEKFIVNYMLLTNNIGDNNDQLMRQLGYAGKGSIKYILNKIQQKMLTYAKENNIVFDL